MSELCLITGATSGIGYETAKELLRRGERVVVHGRSEAKARAAAERMLGELGGDDASRRVETVGADLADLDAVRRLAAEIRARYERLDVLIHNAGLERWERELAPTSDDGLGGHELTFTVNHLAPFLLTYELLDALAGTRVIFVSSLVHQWGEIHWDDLDAAEWYAPEAVYYQSKLASVLAGMELAWRAAPRNVQIVFAPPGLTKSSFSRDFRGPAKVWTHTVGRWMFRETAEVGREYAELATSPEYEGRSGVYVDRLRVGHPAPNALDRAAQLRMWERTCELLGIDRDELPASSELTPFSGPATEAPGLSAWIAALAAGELLGFSAVALVGLLAMAIFGAPESVGAHVVAALVMGVAGLMEGASLGYFQWRAMRRWVPRLTPTSWMKPTALVAGFGWLLGMLVPAVGMVVAPASMGEEAARAGEGPGMLATVLFATVFGALVGALFGAAQWTVLRRHVAGAGRWVAFNALGWALGLPITYVAGGLGSPDMSLASGIALAAGAAVVMGLGVALGSWAAFGRMQPRPV